MYEDRERLTGLVVKASASRAADPGHDSHLNGRDFSGWSHTNWHFNGYLARRLALLGLVGSVTVYCDCER